jgi:hypothetical protein
MARHAYENVLTIVKVSARPAAAAGCALEDPQSFHHCEGRSGANYPFGACRPRERRPRARIQRHDRQAHSRRLHAQDTTLGAAHGEIDCAWG